LAAYHKPDHIRCTTIIAFVFAVITLSIFEGSIRHVVSSTSTGTGVAPASETASQDAM